MNDDVFFRVVVASEDEGVDAMVFVVRAEDARTALLYVESTRGRVISIEPEDYFDFIAVPEDFEVTVKEK